MTTTTEKNDRSLIGRIEKLDSGDLARLRRACGERDLAQGRCYWFAAYVPPDEKGAPEFLIATLLAQYKTSVIQEGGHRLKEGNFGATWRAAILVGHENPRGIDGDGISNSLKRRFNTLLDADYDVWTGEGDLPFRLRQMVKYAAAKGVGVNWNRLLDDVKTWSHPRKHVQQNWAKGFFANERLDEAAKTEEESE